MMWVMIWVMICILMVPSIGVAETADSDATLEVGSDITGHWAEIVMSDWIEKGWIEGYPDGSIRPNDPVTRAELAALIGHHLDMQTYVNGIPFDDVNPQAWYASGISKLVELDAVSGYDDGSFRPDRKITRQEAAVLIAGITGLTGDGDGVNDLFSDNLPVWSRPAAQVVQGFGWMVGDTAGTFRPRANLTRAETVVALDSMFKQFTLQQGLVLDQARNYGPNQGRVSIDSDVELKTSGIHLQQVDVLGQLTVGEDIGDGDAELTNVRVEGETFIRGGGENSVHLNGVNLTETVVDKESGFVRIVASDESSIELLNVNSPTLFELDSGEIDELVIGEGAAGTVITLAEGTVIRKLIVYAAPVTFKGAGTIEEAEIYAEPVTFENPPLSMSCGGSSICPQTGVVSNDSRRDRTTVTELVYSPASLVLEGLGSVESIELQAIWSNSSQTIVTTEAEWTSENDSVASVSDGAVTSIGYGDTNVLAAYRGHTVRMPVSVVPTVTGLVYDPTSLYFDVTGESARIELAIALSDGEVVDVSEDATWSSLDVSVASVDAGEVTAQGFGATTVRAAYDGLTVEVPVVVESVVTGLVADPASLSFAGLWDPQQISLEASYSDGSTVDVTAAADWTSVNPSVATVNDSGMVNPVSAGVTVVSAVHHGQTVEVPAVVESVMTGLVAEPASLSFAELWDPQQISLETSYSDGSTVDVTDAANWTSADSSVATVDDSGMVTPIGAGNTVISAVYAGQTVEVPVEANVVLTGVRSSVGGSLDLGGASGPTAVQLIAEYSDGSEQDVSNDVTWSSANSGVATVSASGTITPIAHGDTVITASYEGIDTEISVSVEVAFTGGTGSVTEPYEITTAEQVSGLRFYTGEQSEDVYFELTGDVDMSTADFIDEVEGWVPIGTDSAPFLGTLDGNGHTISNLRIDRPDQNDQGLFGSLEGTVKNLHLEEVEVTGKNRVGALAGDMFDSTIEGVTATGSIVTTEFNTGGSNAGGLIGYATGSVIQYAGADVAVTGVDHNIGGLVGRAYNTQIIQSYSHGDVNGRSGEAINMGGLVGSFSGNPWDDISIQDSHATGTINNGGFRSGGLVGVITDASITNAYASGTVNASGGSLGGLVGDPSNVTIEASFYTDDQYGEAASRGTVITAVELADMLTFTDAGWIFPEPWVMGADRPVLWWE